MIYATNNACFNYTVLREILCLECYIYTVEFMHIRSSSILNRHSLDTYTVATFMKFFHNG